MTFALSIGPFWNWNPEQMKSHSSPLTTFNRSFLELKYDGYTYLQCQRPAFNRSFLELKSTTVRDLYESNTLSIGPFWNWNASYKPYSMRSLRLSIGPFWNWNKVTAEGLDKLVRFQSVLSGIEIFDHFFFLAIARVFQSVLSGIEIWSPDRPCCPGSPFNRSFLELKSVVECPELPKNCLSIGPFWNWNFAKYHV